MKQILLVLTLLSCLCTATQARDSIYVDIEIKGQPARMVFDTGSTYSVLFRPSADRLKLKVTESDPSAKVASGKVQMGFTEQCKVKIWNEKVEARFGVFDFPQTDESNGDGAIGWQTVKENILVIDLAAHVLAHLPVLPKEVSNGNGFLWPRTAPL